MFNKFCIHLKSGRIYLNFPPPVTSCFIVFLLYQRRRNLPPSPPHHSFEVNLWGIDFRNFLRFCSRKVLIQIWKAEDNTNLRTKREIKSDHYSLCNRENEFAGGRARTLVTPTTSEALPSPPPSSKDCLLPHKYFLESGLKSRAGGRRQDFFFRSTMYM